MVKLEICEKHVMFIIHGERKMVKRCGQKTNITITESHMKNEE